MPFTQDTFAPIGGQAAASPSSFSYSSPDSLVTILAADYFNDKRFQLNAKDLIYTVASDGVLIIVYQGSSLPSTGLPSLPNKNNIFEDYQVLSIDQYIISDGGNTITLPLFSQAIQPVLIINSGLSNDTINGNGKTVPNSTTLSPSQARGFIPGISEWSEF